MFRFKSVPISQRFMGDQGQVIYSWKTSLYSAIAQKKQLEVGYQQPPVFSREHTGQYSQEIGMTGFDLCVCVSLGP